MPRVRCNRLMAKPLAPTLPAGMSLFSLQERRPDGEPGGGRRGARAVDASAAGWFHPVSPSTVVE